MCDRFPQVCQTSLLSDRNPYKMTKSSSNVQGLVLLLLTSVFFIIGLMFDYMPMIVDSQIKKRVELATNEEIKALWSRPPIDINSFFWLYDVNNVEEFMNGEKIRVTKVGPYQFYSRIEKRVIELSANKYRLTYNSTRHIYLNESVPQDNLDQPLRLLNPVYASLIEATRSLGGSQMDAQMRQTIISSSTRLAERFNESIFINTTAREALLGRHVVLLEKARKLAETFGVGFSMPSNVGDRFGYVALMNGTWQGPFEIYTGYQATVSSLGEIISYQGKKRLNYYQGKCNRLQTSAGELRPMPLVNEQTLEMFQPQFCRITHLKPSGWRKRKEGIVINYAIDPSDFLSAELNSENQCFCINSTTDTNYCSLNGAIELAPCSYYSPIIMTINNIPIDPRVTNSIQDWDHELIDSEVELLGPPDNSSHFYILKRIGVPFGVDITITLFMRVTRDPRYRLTATVPEVSYIPIMMVRESGSIPSKLSKVIINMESFLALSQYLKVIMYMSALVLLGWLTGYYFNRSTRDQVMPSGGGLDSSSSQSVFGSADSRRSRTIGSMSHGSMGASNNANGMASEVPQAISVKRDSRPNGAPLSELERPMKRSIRLLNSEGTTTGRPEGQKFRVFSKVGEQLAPTTDKLTSEMADQSRPGEHSAELEQRATKPLEGSNRSWFLKVCSNFVRSLNEIRRAINDAGQINMSENDHQDKQLEMLAGRIDNWYSSSAEEPARQELRTDSGSQAARVRRDLVGDEPEAPAPARPAKTPDEELVVGSKLDEGFSSGSAKSSQTILNKGEMSGHESEPVASDDKAAALKQMELALLEEGELAAKPASMVEPGKASEQKHLMIDSSTSIDSQQLLNDNPATSGQRQAEAEAEGAPNKERKSYDDPTSQNQSVNQLNDSQIDESSLHEPSKQSVQLASNVVSGPNNTNDIQSEPISFADGLAKDERRDSGVKLDSRNGISYPSLTPLTGPGNGQTNNEPNGTVVEPALEDGNELGAALQHVEPNYGQITGHSARLKLLNDAENNISNGEIMSKS